MKTYVQNAGRDFPGGWAWGGCDIAPWRVVAMSETMHSCGTEASWMQLYDHEPTADELAAFERKAAESFTALGVF